MLLTHEKNKKKLDDLIDIQCSSGNWDYDGYMHGIANGMLLSRSCVDDKDVTFLDPPKKYLYKNKYLRSIITQWNKIFNRVNTKVETSTG